jgi:Ca2+-binding RTX toxin-like protein
LTGSAYKDALYGNAGNDTLNGVGGDDVLYGEDGADALVGGIGNDTFSGGAGNDYLQGDSGSDTYLFGPGGGGDTIYDYFSGDTGVDTLEFTGGIDRADVDFLVEGNNLRVQVRGTSDSVLIQNWFISSGYRLNQFKFSDGTTLTAAQLEAESYKVLGTTGNDSLTGSAYKDALYGYAGNDTLYGNNGDDTLYGGDGSDTLYGGNNNDIVIGGAGNDYLEGNAGSDTYQFGPGHGVDTINTYNTDYGSTTDTLEFTGGINKADVDFLVEGNHLRVQVRGASDSVLIQNWFYANSYRMDQFKFSDGTTLTAAQLEAEGYNVLGTSGNDSLTGSAYKDALYGYAGNDTLNGGNGDDILDGGLGADSMLGGIGNDTYYVDNTSDIISEGSNAGTDQVQSAVSYTLSSNVENLTLTGTSAINGTGNTLNNVLIGNSVNNILNGNAGNDTLDGGAGADTMNGGIGNDNYVVDNSGDVVTEYVNEGTDTVQSSIDYTLGANVENLTMTGTTSGWGTGNDLNNVIIGNSIANNLAGNGGNDTLDGGAGVDTMSGGLGNDTYVVDNSGDVVTEYANEGTDTVQSSIDYTLGANVENLTMTGTTSGWGTGNDLNNVIIGNSIANNLAGNGGNDTLDGGAGVDTMSGGLGNDTYVVDNSGDVVTEYANEGTDTVQSSIDYTLGANVENLTLTGTSAINGTGNTLNNVIIGNSANNILSGGAGADTMNGGIGNDIYIVDNSGDIINEGSNAGTDQVQSTISFTLSSNVENLTLTGTLAINGTGNTLNNVLIGNSSNNILSGNAGNDTLDGGAGVDSMYGGAGNDTYVVDNTGDLITENANEGVDTVQSSVDYTLSANVENLTMTGTTSGWGTGNDLNNVIIGNSIANNLAGNAGNDTLDGGAGVDTMSGGLGNDTYVVDNSGDVVTEYANEGTDTVQSSIDYTLGSYVENLTLTGTSAINGTGNTLNNVLTGNSGVNTLTGNAGNDTLDGGLGNDSLVGGTGNDSYKFRRTDGQDTLNDYSTTTTDSDTLQLTDGITSTEPVIVKQNGDLYIFVDGSNYVKITSQFTAATYGIERLEVSDGHYITRSDIESIVNTMSAINNNTGMDVMQKYNAMMQDQTYISTLAATWQV